MSAPAGFDYVLRCQMCDTICEGPECPKCDRAKTTKEYSETEVLNILKNSGVDVDCGACMEVAFTGGTLAQHTCKSGYMPRIEQGDMVLLGEYHIRPAQGKSLAHLQGNPGVTEIYRCVWKRP